jgi:DNA-binding NarL/FixJ family response regulator
MMVTMDTEFSTTSVLFIDANKADRTYFAEGLKRCSTDYRILEATDRESGLALYRAQRIDCVVLELDLQEQSGFEVLVQLVPYARRPEVAVIILSRLGPRGLWKLAQTNGAYACLVKKHTTGEILDKVVRSAIGWIGILPKEDRYRPI